ncbi:hypothetical protein GCM10007175_36320 [Pseudarthrobacter scleromae]|uniref:Uncharacterized protein n=1 Tax=Pseudarthrobacter scleromae TaxID=158897 RepID=A0ABQ2CLZ5_9MICC|nr:hypothetical protein GCM10007175_36320 [Pseudarthrobacter scleromae]
MLEGELRFFIDEPAGHHKVAGNPFRALCFKCLDLVLGGAVEFLARDVLIDLRRPLPVRTVRAAEVADVGFANGAVFLTVPAKGTGTCVSPAGATIEIARCAVLAVATAGTVAAVTERLPVLSPAETAAVSLAVTARTITERLLVSIAIRLAVTVTEGLAVTVTEGLAVTVTEGLPLPATETAAVSLAVTTRTITERLLVSIAIRLAVTERLALPATERLALPATEPAAVPFAVTARTVTKGLLVTIAIRLAVTVTEGLPLPATEPAAVPFAVTTRTVTKGLLVTIAIRLAVTVAKRLPLPATGRTSGGLAAVAVAAGAETPGVTARIVVAPESAAVISAAVAPVVLSHVDSSCYELTTGATAAARIRVSFPTQPEIKRFEVRTSSSILEEPPRRAARVKPSTPHRGNIHTLSHLMRGFL